MFGQHFVSFLPPSPFNFQDILSLVGVAKNTGQGFLSLQLPDGRLYYFLGRGRIATLVSAPGYLLQGLNSRQVWLEGGGHRLQPCPDSGGGDFILGSTCGGYCCPSCCHLSLTVIQSQSPHTKRRELCRPEAKTQCHSGSQPTFKTVSFREKCTTALHKPYYVISDFIETARPLNSTNSLPWVQTLLATEYRDVPAKEHSQNNQSFVIKHLGGYWYVC